MFKWLSKLRGSSSQVSEVALLSHEVPVMIPQVEIVAEIVRSEPLMSEVIDAEFTEVTASTPLMLPPPAAPVDLTVPKKRLRYEEIWISAKAASERFEMSINSFHQRAKRLKLPRRPLAGRPVGSSEMEYKVSASLHRKLMPASKTAQIGRLTAANRDKLLADTTTPHFMVSDVPAKTAAVDGGSEWRNAAEIQQLAGSSLNCVRGRIVKLAWDRRYLDDGKAIELQFRIPAGGLDLMRMSRKDWSAYLSRNAKASPAQAELGLEDFRKSVAEVVEVKDQAPAAGPPTYEQLLALAVRFKATADRNYRDYKETIARFPFSQRRRAEDESAFLAREANREIRKEVRQTA
jgi:hypothetical protein